MLNEVLGKEMALEQSLERYLLVRVGVRAYPE